MGCPRGGLGGIDIYMKASKVRFYPGGARVPGRFLGRPGGALRPGGLWGALEVAWGVKIYMKASKVEFYPGGGCVLLSRGWIV